MVCGTRFLDTFVLKRLIAVLYLQVLEYDNNNASAHRDFAKVHQPTFNAVATVKCDLSHYCIEVIAPETASLHALLGQSYRRAETRERLALQSFRHTFGGKVRFIQRKFPTSTIHTDVRHSCM